MILNQFIRSCTDSRVKQCPPQRVNGPFLETLVGCECRQWNKSQVDQPGECGLCHICTFVVSVFFYLPLAELFQSLCLIRFRKKVCDLKCVLSQQQPFYGQSLILCIWNKNGMLFFLKKNPRLSA